MPKHPFRPLAGSSLCKRCGHSRSNMIHPTKKETK